MSQVTCTRSIPFGRPWISEADRKAVLKVLEGHILTHGPECTQFENEFAEQLGPRRVQSRWSISRVYRAPCQKLRNSRSRTT